MGLTVSVMGMGKYLVTKERSKEIEKTVGTIDPVSIVSRCFSSRVRSGTLPN